MRTKLLALSLLAGCALVANAQAVWDQGFETDTSGWFDASSGWYGTITQVPSGTSGITSLEGLAHATVLQDSTSAPFSRFDGYRSVFPAGGYRARLAVYLDPAWAAGVGFEYSVASSRSSGAHLRDYVFHCTKDTSTGQLLLYSDTNAYFQAREDIEFISHHALVPTAGWYILEHVFYDAGGVLAVDMNLLDANADLLWTETRSYPADLIDTVVGGNRYAWFTFVDVTGGLAIDNHQLFLGPWPTTVGLDVKPGSDVNPITTKGKGTVPAAILGSATLNVHDVDISSLELGGMSVSASKQGKTQTNYSDVNGDGYLDLVCHFDSAGSTVAPGDTEITLFGYLLDSTPIVGVDSIKTVP